ncbi:MAG: TM0996/MTH895 family glutaredoxin-like protein [Phycisphaerales bacterium]|nr:TM0996/MTH895 family glutaredoxin-like protein [Phycisphaerales bacterium]
MKIVVLGTGCPKCHALADAAKKVADQLGIAYTLERVTDIGKITDYGVMMTPALVIDGKVKVVGKVPSESELSQLLQKS